MHKKIQTKRVSSKGQITIPKKIRDRVGFSKGSDVVVQIHGDTVVLQRTPKNIWRKWAGRFTGTGVLDELKSSRRDEIELDSKAS